MLSYFVLFLNVLCMLAAWIWIVVLGFRASRMWGILNMIPLVGIVWMIRHRKEARGPLKVFLTGLVCLVINWRLIVRDLREERAARQIELAEAGPEEGNGSGLEEVTTAPAEALEASDAASPPAQPAPPPEVGQPEPVSAAAVSSESRGRGEATTTGTVTAQPPAPSASSVYVADAPIDTLWIQYYTAVSHVMANDPRGIREFEICLSADDAAWLRQNMTIMAELLEPGLIRTHPEKARLAVLQALLRNMPTTRPLQKPEIVQSKAVAVARLTCDTPTGPQSYTTLLVQEAGRWVLAQPFYVRPFVWTPQLAHYKQTHGLPLSHEEQVYLHAGFAPFQQQISGVYAALGYRER